MAGVSRVPPQEASLSILLVKMLATNLVLIQAENQDHG